MDLFEALVDQRESFAADHAHFIQNVVSHSSVLVLKIGKGQKIKISEVA